jgi:hypothetical protein
VPALSAALVCAALSPTLLLSGGCDGRTAEPLRREVGECSWSYFGDPRSVAYGEHVFTGCAGTRGGVLVEDYDLVTGTRRYADLLPDEAADDHNNPSVVVFRDRLYAFFSPHSGYRFGRHSRMRYRVAARPLAGGRFGPLRTIPLGRGCDLGYTYPNPVVAGGRLYLFMRGPCWAPYFTWTDDGRTWVPPRTLVRSPDSRLQDGGNPHRVRPYAKYAGAGNSVLIALSDGHPASFRSSLYFVRLEGTTLRAADGRPLGTLADLPFDFDELDRVARYSPAGGRAWPMDVALGRDRQPVIAYSALHGVSDTFRYARWDRRAWRTHAIVPAGKSLFTYHNSGITLDHADPRRVVLSRTIAGQNEIELRLTTDHGAHWSAVQLTRGSSEFNIRPVIPRGRPAGGPLVVLWVAGRARSFRDFDTRVVMAVRPLGVPQRSALSSDIPRTWPSWGLDPSSTAAGSSSSSVVAAWGSSTARASSSSTATSPSRSSRPTGSRTIGRAAGS